MSDVFFYEAFAEEAEALQRLLPADIPAGYSAATIQESGHAQPPARVISVRTQSQLPPAWAGRLTAILSRSTGYDHLVAYRGAVRGQGVAEVPELGYLPLYCHRAVAEHALMLWLALLRRLPRQRRQFATFQRDGLTGLECTAKVLVVVGVGHIGAEILAIGAALGMTVIGVDRQADRPGVRYADILQALPQADVIVCAMDLNASNRGYFTAELLASAKRGAIFINISRGELSPSTELLAALERGQLGGVGLDVFDHEAVLAGALRAQAPLAAIDDVQARAAIALSLRDDVLCTPHNAFNSVEAVERKSAHSVQTLISLRQSGRFLWSAPG